ncbi:MAG: biotin/lipoyl-binding protein, partial [Planctomycetota bacterium]|nr:biotin/lipoyl-binding protein [Planctomycetota bacterium]
MKTLIWIIVGVLLIGGLGTYFVASGKGVPVDAAEATQGPIREFVDERGKTRLPQTHLITMPSAGRIESITLSAGTRVKKGQVVAQMVPLDLKLAVEQSEASVRQLQASIKENAATNVEETALSQAKHFVKSMHDTVAAAATRVLAGQAKLDYAEKHYGRVAPLAKTGALTQDELDQAILEKVSSSVAYREDELI